MKNVAATLLLFLCYTIGFAQNKLTGVVLDAVSENPLPFATVTISHEKTRGVTTNLDGAFTLPLRPTDKSVLVSYMGYINQTIRIDSLQKNHTVRLVPSSYKLSEITILPGLNPAHRIVNNAIAAIDSNNPDNLTAYSCRIYNRTLVKAEPTATSRLSEKQRSRLDSSNLLVLESVVDRSYRFRDITQERVVANRVSGISNPPFALMATTFQPFHFYKSKIELLGKQFLNPLTPNSTRSYIFTIQDTLITPTDTTFIIQFTPRLGTNFEGLKGFLHISTNRWGIRNVVAERAAEEGISFRIEQQYALRQGRWFPDQYRYHIILKNYPPGVGVNSSYEGTGTVYDVAIGSSAAATPSRSSLSIADSAARSYAFIERYRSAPLTARDSATYALMDSVGKKIGLDRKMTAIPSWAKMSVPYRIFSFPIGSLISFNEYEGARLGLEIETNQRLTRYADMGGYFAYGTKDKAWKYGGKLSVYPLGNIKTRLRMGFRHDVDRPTVNLMVNEQRSADLSTRFLLERADRIREFEVGAKSHLWDITTNLKAKRTELAPTYSYRFRGVEQLNRWSTNAELSLDLRLGFKERETNFFDLYFYSQQDYPVLGVRIRQGIQALAGSYRYSSVEIGTYKKFSLRKAGDLRTSLLGGYLWGNVPYSFVFGSNSTNSWYFSLLVTSSFVCAAPFEYASTRYGSLFLYYDLNSLLYSTKHFKPKVSVYQAAGWSELTTAPLYEGLRVKDMQKGYFESGLILSNLIRHRYFNIVYVGVGGGAFVAYGGAVDKPLGKTLTFKATLTFDF